MVRLTIFFVWYCSICIYSEAQVVKTDDGVILKGPGRNKGLLQIRVVSDKIIRITDCSAKVLGSAPNLLPYETFTNKSFHLIIDHEKVVLKTTSLQVIIEFQSRKVIFKDLNNRPLLTEGTRTYTLNKKDSKDPWNITQEFQWSNEEILHIFGMDPSIRTMSEAGDSLLITENAGRYPLIVSSKGYGIVWGNKFGSCLNTNETVRYCLSECSQQVDYYFLFGLSTEEVAQNYCRLTGKTIEMPKLAQRDVEISSGSPK